MSTTAAETSAKADDSYDPYAYYGIKVPEKKITTTATSDDMISSKPFKLVTEAPAGYNPKFDPYYYGSIYNPDKDYTATITSATTDSELAAESSENAAAAASTEDKHASRKEKYLAMVKSRNDSDSAVGNRGSWR